MDASAQSTPPSLPALQPFARFLHAIAKQYLPATHCALLGNGNLLYRESIYDAWEEIPIDRTPIKVERFTGAFDSAGRPIFEGDIIDGTSRGTLEEPAEYSRVVAQWNDDRLRWEADDPFCGEAFELGDFALLDHVVGNLNETPWLLSGAEGGEDDGDREDAVLL